MCGSCEESLVAQIGGNLYQAPRAPLVLCAAARHLGRQNNAGTHEWVNSQLRINLRYVAVQVRAAGSRRDVRTQECTIDDVRTQGCTNDDKRSQQKKESYLHGRSRQWRCGM